MNTPGFTAEDSLYRRCGTYVRQSPRNIVASGGAEMIHPAIIRWGALSMCSGDADCNGMFETACSANGYAQCWIRGPNDSSVFCMCT
jgi:hypothetical protein